jgi:RecA-family ATPase
MSDANHSIISKTQHAKTFRLPGESINIRSAMEDELPALDFVWSGFLAGTVGVLVAPGATGKSFWALQAAMSIAGGDLIELLPKKIGQVAYLAGEDPKPILQSRLKSIGQHLSTPVRDNIYKNLQIRSLMGECLDVMEDRLLELLIAEYAGYRLIVFDTLSRMHRLDENSNGDMAQVVARFERLAAKTGASVLYLHHVNKTSSREGQADQQIASRGASTLVNNPRWCGFMARMTEKESEHLSERHFERSQIGERRSHFVRFGVSKQNYGEDLPDQWYQRHDGGVLLPVSLVEVGNAKRIAKPNGVSLSKGANNDWQ